MIIFATEKETNTNQNGRANRDKRAQTTMTTITFTGQVMSEDSKQVVNWSHRKAYRTILRMIEHNEITGNGEHKHELKKLAHPEKGTTIMEVRINEADRINILIQTKEK